MKQKLFNKDFTLLWLGQSVSQLGSGAGYIGLLWWIQITTGSALALGTLAMVQTLIGIVLGPFAGAIVDRINRKGIIIGGDVIRGITNLTLFYLLFNGQLTVPIVFVLAGINAVCNQFFNPAISASLPLIVPNERLEQANSLSQVSISLVNIFGYAAGGIMVAFFGIEMLLFINGASFLFSALSEAFIHIPSVRKEGQKLTFRLFGTDVKDGFRYVFENRTLFKVMQVAMILNFFSAPVFILLPKFVNEYMAIGNPDLGARIFGFLLSAQMIGAFATTLLMSSTNIVKNNLWLVRWGLTGIGLTVLGLVVAPGHLWGIHIGLFALMGVLNSMINVYFVTVLQRATRPDYMGKVFSLLTTIGHSLQPLSQGLSGVVAELVRVPIIYLVSGTAVFGGGMQFVLIPDILAFLRGEKQVEAAETVQDAAVAAGK